MLLRQFIFAAILSLGATAHAAFTTCVLETQPCDRAGGHYFCSVIGWTGANPPRFCSEHDVSNGPGKTRGNPPPVPFSSCHDTRGRVSVVNFRPSGTGAVGTAVLYLDANRGELNCAVSADPASQFLVECSGSIVVSPATQAHLRITFPNQDPNKIGVLEVSQNGNPPAANDLIPVACD